MLEFRPHHFLCTLGFEGKGYSEEFTRNFARIAEGLLDPTLIRVTPATDAICAPCPNRRGQTCTTEEKIRRLDDAHAAVLGIRAGDTLSWGQAKERIAGRMSEEAFESACAPCAWKGLGVCKAALLRLKREKGGETP